MLTTDRANTKKNKSYDNLNLNLEEMDDVTAAMVRKRVKKKDEGSPGPLEKIRWHRVVLDEAVRKMIYEPN